MKVGNLINQNTNAYTHSAYTKQIEAAGAINQEKSKSVFSGTLHIEKALAASMVLADYDLQNISPREMSQLSSELYEKGVLSQEENNILSFQPELHPDYDEVIGKKTDTRAAPDRKRDYLKIWQEKVDMFSSVGNSKEAYNAGQVLNILKNLDAIGMQHEGAEVVTEESL